MAEGVQKIVQESFEEVDKDKDGRINAQELQLLLPKFVSLNLTEELCENLISQVSQNGTIDCEQFINIVSALQQQEAEEEEEEQEQNEEEEQEEIVVYRIH